MTAPVLSGDASVVPGTEYRRLESFYGGVQDFRAYDGIYTDRAYGSFEICSAASNSSTCARVVDDFRAVDGNKNTTTSDSHAGELYAHWPRLWLSHLRFVPHERTEEFDVFSLTGSTLYPHGFGADRTPFEAYPEIHDVSAHFVWDAQGKVSGFGIVGPGREETERVKWG